MLYFESCKSFLIELKKRNLLLAYTAFIFTALFGLFLLSFAICAELPFSDICFWLKPFKFSLSFALYALTLGWIMDYLKPVFGENLIKNLSIAIVSLLFIEIIVLLIQSVQHTDSYYEVTFFRQHRFVIANVLEFLGYSAILLSTLVALYISFLFFYPISLTPSAYLWSIRIGFVIFILSCFLGYYLHEHYPQLNTEPSGLGLPFTQLSSNKNNLLSLHFVGIHALQIFPVLGYYLKNYSYLISVPSLIAFTVASGYLITSSLVGV